MRKIAELTIASLLIPTIIIIYYILSRDISTDHLLIFLLLLITLGLLIGFRSHILTISSGSLTILYITAYIFWGSVIPYIALVPILIIPLLYIATTKRTVYSFEISVIILISLEMLGILPLNRDEMLYVGIENLILLKILVILSFLIINRLLDLAFITVIDGQKIDILIIKGLYSSLLSHTNKNLINSFIWQSDNSQKKAILDLLGNHPNRSASNTYELNTVLSTTIDYYSSKLKIHTLNKSIPKNISHAQAQLITIILFDLLSNISQHGDASAPVLLSYQNDRITLRNALLPSSKHREPRSLSLAARYLEKTNLGSLTWKVENGEWVVRVEIY